MKKTFFVIALLLISSIALADVPKYITVQGRLTDMNNVPVPSASYTFNFSIENSTGTILWSEIQNIYVANGLFNAEIGRTKVGGISLPFDQDYYLETWVNGNKLSPRVNITSAGYAFVSGGISGNLNMGGKNITNIGMVGIGTATPSHKLTVVGDVNVTGSIASNRSYGPIVGDCSWTGCYMLPNGASYINILYVNQTLALDGYGVLTTFTQSGSLGGDISGNFSYLTINAGAVGTTELADNAVTTSKIANNAVTLGTKTSGDYVGNVTAGSGISISGTVGEGWIPTITNIGDLSSTNEIQNVIANKGLQRDASNNFGIMNCADGQIMKYSGGIWSCSADSTGILTSGWTVSGNKVYNDSTTVQVGIGTSTLSSHKLTVVGDANVTGSIGAYRHYGNATGDCVADGCYIVPQMISFIKALYVNDTLALGGIGVTTGSGTANYLAKWNSGNNLGNSIIYDNGKVGIGTSSPVQKLDVVGNINTTGNMYFSTASSLILVPFDFKIWDKDYSKNRLWWTWVSGLGDYVNLTATGSNTVNPTLTLSSGYGLLYSYNNNEQLRVSTGGNVGIGTIPTYKLDVAGAMRLQPVAAPTAANGVIYYDSSSNKFKCYENGAWKDCIGGSVTDIWVDVTGDSMFGTLDMGGYDINNAQVHSFHIYNGPGTLAAPSYTFDMDKDTGIYNPSANVTAFTNGAVERMRIDSNGKVGIGTTTPLQALDVRGNIHIGAAGAGAKYLRFATYETNEEGTARHYIGVENDGFNMVADDAPQPHNNINFKVDNNGGTTINVMTINGSTSRVGIGTTNPAYKLDINGVASATTFRTRSQTCPSGWTCELNTWDIAAQSAVLYGSVGIGLAAGSTPSGTLHVKGNANVLSLEGTDHSYIAWYPDGISTRKGWTGWGSASDNNFFVTNEISGANIVLNTNGGSVISTGSHQITGNDLFIGTGSSTQAGIHLYNKQITGNPATHLQYYIDRLAVWSDSGSWGGLQIEKPLGTRQIQLDDNGDIYAGGIVGIGTTPIDNDVKLNVEGIETPATFSDGFEDGTLDPFSSSGWTYPWTVTTTYRRTGTYGAVSGTAPAMSSTGMVLYKKIATTGTISFAATASPVSGAYGDFEICNEDTNSCGGLGVGWCTEKYRWSAATSWTTYSFTLPACRWKLQWSYNTLGTAGGYLAIDDVQVTNTATGTWAAAAFKGPVAIGGTHPATMLDVGGDIIYSGSIQSISNVIASGSGATTVTATCPSNKKVAFAVGYVADNGVNCYSNSVPCGGPAFVNCIGQSSCSYTGNNNRGCGNAGQTCLQTLCV